MPGASDIQAPVGHDHVWVQLAVLSLVLVAVYYVVVLVALRTRGPRRTPPPRGAREDCLVRLDDIADRVGAGTTSPRAGHQEVSAAVREFVARASGTPADRMTLADLRAGRTELSGVAGLVGLLYPPAFVADGRVATERFDEVLDEARRLVRGWP